MFKASNPLDDELRAKEYMQGVLDRREGNIENTRRFLQDVLSESQQSSWVRSTPYEAKIRRALEMLNEEHDR